MKQIIVQIKNSEKAKILFELLKTMDFIDQVTVGDLENDVPSDREKGEEKKQPEEQDFFSLAGIWTNREGLDSLRKKAWPRQD